MQPDNNVSFSDESFPTECDVSTNRVRGRFQPGANGGSIQVRAFFQPPTVFFQARSDGFSNQIR